MFNTISNVDFASMYFWGSPYILSLDVYKWIMKGETTKIRFKRVCMVYNKRRKENRYV